MTEQEAKLYIESIRHTRKFMELNRFLKVTEYKDPETGLFENFKLYLCYQHKRMDINEPFVPDYEHFYKFFEEYRGENTPQIVKDARGYIDLGKTSYLKKPFRFTNNLGFFTDAHIIMSDGEVFISKIPLYCDKKSGVTTRDSLYCSIIASEIAKQLGIETAEYKIACNENGTPRVLSKYFLKPHEELITFFKDSKDNMIDVQKNGKIRKMPTVSYTFNELEKELSLRKFSADEIEMVKFNFLKQELLAKLIGLKDQKADNTGLVISMDENRKRHVKMAPMFDYDYSFHIPGDIFLYSRQCDNGKDDIVSLIEQYKDYPGFLEFAINSIQSLDIKQVFKSIYQNQGIKDFENLESNELLRPFVEFIDYNRQLAIDTLQKILQNEREEI